MKTMFSNQFFSREIFSVAPPVPPRPQYAMQGRWLGQNDYTTIDENYRNKFLTKVGESLKKLPALNDIIALSSDMPLFRSFMEPDSITFLNLSNEAAALYPGVKAVYDRFSSDSAENWYAAPAEMDAAELWTRKIDQMYGYYLTHFPQNAPPLPKPIKMGPTTVTPTFTSTGVPKPIASGVPAAAIPGAPSGFNTNNLLIGGGLAVALGVLIYAVL